MIFCWNFLFEWSYSIGKKYICRVSRRALKALGNTIARMLEESGTKIRYPHGGFYLFPDFSPFRERLLERNIQTSTELCRKLLQDTGVAILPGSEFGRKPEELNARLAYVDFDGKSVLKGLDSIPKYQIPDEDFLEKYCPNVMEAIRRINDWMNA